MNILNIGLEKYTERLAPTHVRVVPLGIGHADALDYPNTNLLFITESGHVLVDCGGTLARGCAQARIHPLAIHCVTCLGRAHDQIGGLAELAGRCSDLERQRYVLEAEKYGLDINDTRPLFLSPTLLWFNERVGGVAQAAGYESTEPMFRVALAQQRRISPAVCGVELEYFDPSPPINAVSDEATPPCGWGVVVEHKIAYIPGYEFDATTYVRLCEGGLLHSTATGIPVKCIIAGCSGESQLGRTSYSDLKSLPPNIRKKIYLVRLPEDFHKDYERDGFAGALVAGVPLTV